MQSRLDFFRMTFLTTVVRDFDGSGSAFFASNFQKIAVTLAGLVINITAKVITVFRRDFYEIL